PKPGKWMTWVKYAFGVFILGFAAYYGQLAWSLSGAPQAADASAGGWTPSLEEGLRRALDEKKPVIVDFWATWCKNCSLMDKTILKDDEVLSRLEGYVKVKYQAENLTQSPAREVTGHFGVLGLPTFIVLTPKE
ncbi:MAG TPA: thioredoxin family protein, partial [Candidatus Hydrogenedentes bacterium]|nr:thioredoxin family protein [Candidatus Hydrogenedentota bacterium]